jgi:hypothetical protein
MLTLFRVLRLAVIDLFPMRREKWVILGLVMFGAAISAAELFTAMLFSAIILPTNSNPRTTAEVTLQAALFLTFFGSLRVAGYAQSLYRVTIFEKTFDRREDSSNPGESWRWATAMELTSLLAIAARLGAISAIFFIISPMFGVANVIVALITAEIFGVTVRKQFLTQQDFRDREKAKSPPSSAEKVRARIQASEVSSLFASVGVIVLMGVLIFLSVSGEIEPGDALVLFLAIRMIGQMYSTASSGLMRFTRARVSGG